MASKSVKLTLSISLGFIALFAGILYWIYSGSESMSDAEFAQSMKEFYDEPWYVPKMSNRLTDDGRNMVYCEEAARSPAETMSILDNEKIPYKVEDFLDPYANVITNVRIEFGTGDESQAVQFLRGMNFCMLWVEAQGYEGFNPESYQ